MTSNVQPPYTSKLVSSWLQGLMTVAWADGQFDAKEQASIQQLVQVELAPSDELIQKFSLALEHEEAALEALRLTLIDSSSEPMTPSEKEPTIHSFYMLKPVRQWLDKKEIRDPRVARFLCKLIPSHCPFERDVNLFGHKVVHIPPMCKLNPLYEQLIGLRFRALCYLADECGEDVSVYC